jgi:hypothetical protein
MDAKEVTESRSPGNLGDHRPDAQKNGQEAVASVS